MVFRMRMSFLVALVGMLSLVLVGPVNAQDEPVIINPNSWGILVDSVHVTDYEGYMQTMYTGWDPSYTVTQFGPGDPMIVMMNYTIAGSDPLPLKTKATFRAFGDKRVIQNKKNASGSYRETQMFYPVGAASGVYDIKCILKVRYDGDLVGSSKIIYQVTWSN